MTEILLKVALNTINPNPKYVDHVDEHIYKKQKYLFKEKIECLYAKYIL
jgi:hypothetical protein